MNALGLSTIQKGVNSSIDVNVTDAHSGKFIGSDNINDGRTRNIINGIDITVEQDAGVEPVWNDSTKSFEFKSLGRLSRYSLSNFEESASVSGMTSAFILSIRVE